MHKLKTSLERINPDEMLDFGLVAEESLNLHFERYNWASSKQLTGILLDMACGVGYGSELLVRSCVNLNKVIGIDIDSAVIDYANSRYQHQKLSFEQGDVCTYSYNQKVDCIVSLETIEHVVSPIKLVENFSSLLKKGGYLIASVPITPSTDGNPHHLSDFTLNSFRKLLKSQGFIELDLLIQNQPFRSKAAFDKSDPRISGLKGNLLRSYLKKPSLLLKRIIATAQHGLQNKYATVYCKHA